MMMMMMMMIIIIIIIIIIMMMMMMMMIILIIILIVIVILTVILILILIEAVPIVQQYLGLFHGPDDHQRSFEGHEAPDDALDVGRVQQARQRLPVPVDLDRADLALHVRRTLSVLGVQHYT